MSRTYRRTTDYTYSTLGKIKAERRKDRTTFYYKWLWVDYSKAPSWYNRDFCTRPRRVKERDLIGKIMKGERDPEEVVFPDGKKPFIYYW